MPRLDAWGKVSLLGSGKLVSVVCNDVEVLRTALSCSMQSFIHVTEERVARLTQGTPTGSHIGEACLLQARLRVCAALLRCGYLRLASVVDLFHCTYVQLMNDQGLVKPSRSYIDRLSASSFACLLIKTPLFAATISSQLRPGPNRVSNSASTSCCVCAVARQDAF